MKMTAENKNKPVNNDADAAFAKAVGSVCRAPKTKKQIEEYLAKKGFSGGAISAAVEKMHEYRYLDDAGFAESYISFYGNSKGKRKLKDELKQRGVSEEIVEGCGELYPNQKEIALNSARKFMKNRENNYETMTKLYRHLAGKGFEFSVCGEVVREISANEIEFED